MFDIGFWELTIIAVVALVVIGPERLPGVARTVGVWVGKGRRFVQSVQSDINREVNKSEELAKLIREQSDLKEMHEIIEQTVDETRKTVSVAADVASLESDSSSAKPKHEPKSFSDDKGDTKANNQQSSVSTTSQAHTKPSTADAVNDADK